MFSEKDPYSTASRREAHKVRLLALPNMFCRLAIVRMETYSHVTRQCRMCVAHFDRSFSTVPGNVPSTRMLN
jgi:hypothetical protein